MIKNTKKNSRKKHTKDVFLKNLSKEEKDKSQKKTRERYQNLTEEEKEKRRNKNLSAEKEQKLVEDRSSYYLTHKK